MEPIHAKFHRSISNNVWSPNSFSIVFYCQFDQNSQNGQIGHFITFFLKFVYQKQKQVETGNFLYVWGFMWVDGHNIKAVTQTYRSQMGPQRVP